MLWYVSRNRSRENVPHSPMPGAVTFLFTDIEGSTRLWEQSPDLMRPALARHDAIGREAVERHRGTVVKVTGDGIHAAFEDPRDALAATLEMLQRLADPAPTTGVELRVRCGLHVGVEERRDNDFFGRSVNRAARIMSAAHGGQVLLSQAVADLVRDRLPTGVTLHDLGQVRLRDLATPERVYQVIHPALRQDFPALRSLEATPNNLPQQFTSFVGRERELHEVKALLATTRLVTLLGAGGIGKTRLSLQVAADVLESHSDGAWFVELAPLPDPRLVPQAVASVLGVSEDAGRSVMDALLEHLRDRHVLLVLDNCEHLIAACAELVRRLLQSTLHMKVLASSREALNLRGETAYPVPALAIPGLARMIAPEALARYESVRLFVERATAAQPAFEVTDRNAGSVAAICHRLDGIPLAIELAAVRVRALSAETIAARLDDRFRLLVGGDRTALPRQQTLRALIDWSYDLLTSDERTLLRRLAAFAGDFALEAAESVCAGGELGKDEILDVLTRLVEKSLVVAEVEGTRYRLLDTVRHYAQERLEAAEEEAVRARHLEFYLALAEQARPQLFGPEQAGWLARLDLERGNLLAAHAWCDRMPDLAEQGMRLVSAVRHYWINRGLLTLGERVIVEALDRAGARRRGPARCRALFDAGQLCLFMGRYDDAPRYLEESLSIARELGAQDRIAEVMQPLGMAALGKGDLRAARGYFEEGLNLARGQGDRREILAAVNALAQLHRFEGEFNRAQPLFENVVTLARELGDRESVAVGLLNLAMVSIERGSTDGARAALAEAFTIAADIGSMRVGLSALEVSAGLAACRGEWHRAARLFGAAEALNAQTGLRRDPTDEAFLAPLIERTRQASANAFEAAAAAGRALGYETAIAEARA